MFVLGEPLQHSLIFAVEARSQPQRVGAPEKYPTFVCFGLLHKHWTRLERLARDKHSSLIGTFLSYDEKSFKT
jgi:hypothetical protein